jgi:hypothetical protein
MAVPGGKLVTLRDAANYITALPAKEAELPEVAGRSGRPALGVARSPHRSGLSWRGSALPLRICVNAPHQTRTSYSRGRPTLTDKISAKRKDAHWGSRKFKRDQ